MSESCCPGNLYAASRVPVSARFFLRVVLVCFSCTVCWSVTAMEKGRYEAPDIEKYVSTGQSDGDGDGDGIRETHITRYRNLSGDRVFSMTIDNRLWAWSLDTGGDDDADVRRNYVIRDSDCDGVFDERYRIDEEFHVPACLK